MKTASAISIGCLLFILSCAADSQSGQKIHQQQTPNRTSFIDDSAATVDTLDLIFYFPVNAHAEITSTRPIKADSAVIFVCAAAFTLLENDAIDGLFIDRGNIEIKWVNHGLGGGIVIPDKSSNEKPNILGTDMGKKLDSTFKDSISAMHASFFQQIQLVRDGKALRFQKEFSRFQRRALCIYQGELVVVESVEACTMQKFANVLESCGIPNALYVDMGSWDEGWWRNQSDEMITIGNMRNETDRQSNWFVFKGR